MKNENDCSKNIDTLNSNVKITKLLITKQIVRQFSQMLHPTNICQVHDPEPIIIGNRKRERFQQSFKGRIRSSSGERSNKSRIIKSGSYNLKNKKPVEEECKEEADSINKKMDYFYKPYRRDLFKESESFMSFHNKNPQWTSIADGIIGKNAKIKESFHKALNKYK